ncbi:MAG: hypothetical protein M1818_002649 [Claussenomyces sp. TS43310]|nr:MAG: hypothetical protein M1818_002649 [Claussenomyces sp. TS43310]
MFCEMTPPIGVSIRRLTPERWMMGSSTICERVMTPNPANAIVSWEDGDDTFRLRERAEGEILSLGDGSETGLVHEGGTSAAVWSIGANAFCKVKAWHKGMELESKTIAFIRENAPEIPVPEVIYTWIDHEWNRTFLILRRIRGQTLDNEWSRLAPNQRLQIASKIVEYCRKLASISSCRFESAAGRAVVEPFLHSMADVSHPSWIPRPIGPFSSTALAFHLSAVAPECDLDVGSLFYFYHADLGPTNIIVLDSTVVGILDWESAAYYPKFWIATKARLSAGFYLQNDRTDRKAWSCILGQMLEANGFPQNVDGYYKWRRQNAFCR